MKKHLAEDLDEMLLGVSAEVSTSIPAWNVILNRFEAASGASACEDQTPVEAAYRRGPQGFSIRHSDAGRIVDVTAARQKTFDIMRGQILLNEIDLSFGRLRELDVISEVKSDLAIDTEIARAVLEDLYDEGLIERSGAAEFRIPLKRADRRSLRKEFAQRLALEVSAALEIAVENTDLTELEELNRKMAELAEVNEGHTLKFLYCDLAFHEALLAMAGFDSSLRLLRKSFHRINVSIDHIKRKDGRKHDVVREHRRLIEAIEAAKVQFQKIGPDEYHRNEKVQASVEEIHEAFADHFITAASAWHKNLGPEFQSRPSINIMWNSNVKSPELLANADSREFSSSQGDANA